MLYSLPKIGKAAVSLPHFPTRHQAFIFRAFEYVPKERIARLIGASPEQVEKAAREMGLPDYEPGDIWLRRGYITIIRRMWHILPYEQLLELLEMDEEELARTLRDDDFLDVKLGEKPMCERVVYRELTDEERRATEKIGEAMSDVVITGKMPFEFEYDVPKIEFSGEERFKTRMIYAFSGLYQHAFDVDSEEFLPNEQLKAYQDLGINGLWTQAVLTQLAPYPFEPSLAKGHEERIERMQKMVERLGKYGIKLYLYINEPRSMPIAFFDKHPNLKGHIRGNEACLCVSVPEVKDYLENSIEYICKNVPSLGGFFTITRSENLTNCYSHSGSEGIDCSCPRCKKRSVGEVVTEVITSIIKGARRVSPDIKVFAWSWRWDEHNEDIIRRLPKEAVLLSQSELDMPFEFEGVSGNVLDYSMSIIGPGERAKREWRLARECGLEVGAKVQVNTTWEASTVPALPLSPSIEEHMEGLQSEGVQHLLLSWTLGGYPCRNIAAVAQYFYKSCSYSAKGSPYYNAEKQFVEAFREFPFHLDVLYKGPQNAGPSTLLFDTPTGYEATMTCFAYDDLERWRAIYPSYTFLRQLEKLCSGWERGLALLPEEDEGECATMAQASYCLFRSSRNLVRFVMARDEGRYSDAIEAAQDEIESAMEMLALMNKNPSIGFEASNHYYFSRGQLAEKIVNCQYIISLFTQKS